MPNSEVKCCNADGSVGFPNVRVGHHQVFYYQENPSYESSWGFVIFVGRKIIDFQRSILLIDFACQQNLYKQYLQEN